MISHFCDHVPNIVLMMPKDENELRHMMKTAIEYDEGPIALRYPRMNGLGVELDDELIPLPIGKWEVLREGHHGVILAVGPMVAVAQEAATRLMKENIHVRIVNARFLKPLDVQMLDEIGQSRLPIVTIEEGTLAGGFGSAVAEYMTAEGYDNTIRMLGVPDKYIEHGAVKNQRQEAGLTVEHAIDVFKTLSSSINQFGRTAGSK